jgi:hypothetical protein
MKTFNTIKWFGVALLSSVTMTAAAQSLRTGYFSDSYLYRHRLNPALGNTSGYVGLPLWGNMNVGLSSNFGVKNFIYTKPGGGLTTFMDGSVSASDFLGDLKKNNKLLMDLDFNVLSVGFNAFGGYNTVELGVHSSVGMSLPRDLFAFMKELKNDDYDISDIKVKGRAYGSIELGHSREVNEALRVGAKVKVLLGIAYANAEFDQLKATFTDDAWQMNMRGKVAVACGGQFTTGSDGYVDGYDDATAGLNGFGLGVDLGATYDMGEWVDGLKLSASVLDLGFMRWKDCAVAVANEHNTFTFQGFNNLQMHQVDEDGRQPYTGTIDQQWEDLKDDLEQLGKLTNQGKTTETEALAATISLGAEYELPCYKKVSFGALYTERFGALYDFVEGRINVNYAPSKAFDLSLSGSAGTYGLGWGALANLHLPGFNIFFGSDRIYSGSVNSDFVPLDNASINFSMGINFPFGW